MNVQEDQHGIKDVYTYSFSIGGQDGEVFRNRKGFFTLNIEAVIDSSMKIMNIVARWPGSVHDSTIS